MVDGSEQSGGFQWIYALLGLCFVALAVFRLDEGSALWAAVFGLAALAYAYLSVRFVLPPSLGGVRPQGAGNQIWPPRPLNQRPRRCAGRYRLTSRGRGAGS